MEHDMANSTTPPAKSGGKTAALRKRASDLKQSATAKAGKIAGLARKNPKAAIAAGAAVAAGVAAAAAIPLVRAARGKAARKAAPAAPKAAAKPAAAKAPARKRAPARKPAAKKA
jgi:hypothetical protein